MNTQEVPQQMREARREVLRALATPSQALADDHCKRAACLLNKAVHEIRAHPAEHYDWSLLRPRHARPDCRP